MKNTALYYVQTNGTDAVNRRRFSLEELDYQNQGCPEGWQWVLDNVQTDARRSFADVPHVAPVAVCTLHAWQAGTRVKTCPGCEEDNQLASVCTVDPSPMSEADIYRLDAQAEGEDYQRELQEESKANDSRLFAFTFTGLQLEQISFACQMWKQACEREERPELRGHYQANASMMENLLIQFDGAQPLAESSPTVQGYRNRQKFTGPDVRLDSREFAY